MEDMTSNDAIHSKRVSKAMRAFITSSLKKEKSATRQPDLGLRYLPPYIERFNPTSGPAALIEFLVSAIPERGVYLFGGALRDFALYGKRGFNSDLDIVVSCSSDILSSVIPKNISVRNKFGGFRLVIDNQEVDIWSAPETWAFKNGFFTYTDIRSLLNTTVINWDAILLDLRSYKIITPKNYFRDISGRHLDICFTENPDPQSVLIKILRYISLKEVYSVSRDLAIYVSNRLTSMDTDGLPKIERRKFGNSYITKQVIEFFLKCDSPSTESIDVWDKLYNRWLF